MFPQQQGENTVMENGEKLGEDSVLCPIRQWSIIKAGPYWKPFPYIGTYVHIFIHIHIFN